MTLVCETVERELAVNLAIKRYKQLRDRSATASYWVRIALAEDQPVLHMHHYYMHLMEYAKASIMMLENS